MCVVFCAGVALMLLVSPLFTTGNYKYDIYAKGLHHASINASLPEVMKTQYLSDKLYVHLDKYVHFTTIGRSVILQVYMIFVI